jgi:hypothetical protein
MANPHPPSQAPGQSGNRPDRAPSSEGKGGGGGGGCEQRAGRGRRGGSSG